MEVRCKGRSGPENFVSQMRKTLADAFPSKSVGLGGIFCVQKGQVKIHVMPEYSEKPLKSDADVENWLKFYKMDAPYTCLSFLVSRDPVIFSCIHFNSLKNCKFFDTYNLLFLILILGTRFENRTYTWIE